MTSRVNATSRQLTAANLARSRSFLEVDRAAEPKVTAAEQRVLNLVSRAKTNKEIAADLGISPATVKRHLEKILSKLGLRYRVEAAIYGFTANSCPHHSVSGCVLGQIESGSQANR